MSKKQNSKKNLNQGLPGMKVPDQAPPQKATMGDGLKIVNDLFSAQSVFAIILGIFFFVTVVLVGFHLIIEHFLAVVLFIAICCGAGVAIAAIGNKTEEMARRAQNSDEDDEQE